MTDSQKLYRDLCSPEAEAHRSWVNACAKAERERDALRDKHAAFVAQLRSLPRYTRQIDADQGHVFIDDWTDKDGEWVKWADLERLLADLTQP